MKTFDAKDVFNPLNANDAVSYILSKGYFANTTEQLMTVIQDERNQRVLNLLNFDRTSPCCFCTCTGNFALFLPGDLVKSQSQAQKHQKKYRAFTKEEFCNTFDLGVSVIKYRLKNCDDTTYEAVFTGFTRTINVGHDLFSFTLGTHTYNTEEASEILEYFDENSKEWVPFGIEDTSE